MKKFQLFSAIKGETYKRIPLGLGKLNQFRSFSGSINDFTTKGITKPSDLYSNQRCVIYQRPPPVTQSMTCEKHRSWRIAYTDRSNHSYFNNGWNGSANSLAATSGYLKFDSKEDAIKYAKSMGLNYEMVDNKYDKKPLKRRLYSDRFDCRQWGFERK